MFYDNSDKPLNRAHDGAEGKMGGGAALPNQEDVESAPSGATASKASLASMAPSTITAHSATIGEGGEGEVIEVDFPNWWESIDSSLDGNLGEHFEEDLEEEAADRDRFDDSESAPGALYRDGEGVSESWGESGGARVSEDGSVSYRLDLDPADRRTAHAALTNVSRDYEREVVHNVWEFAEIVPGNDPDLWRKDEFGNWIHRLAYGKRESEFGWEIFDPGIGRHAQGVYAMRPMQWQSFIRQYETLC